MCSDIKRDIAFLIRRVAFYCMEIYFRKYLIDIWLSDDNRTFDMVFCTHKNLMDGLYYLVLDFLIYNEIFSPSSRLYALHSQTYTWSTSNELTYIYCDNFKFIMRLLLTI